MALPPFDKPRERQANLGRLLGGAGWLVAGAAIGALIMAGTGGGGPWSALRAHLPTVTFADRPAGPKPAPAPIQAPGKPAAPEAAPGLSQVPPSLVAQPQLRCEDEKRADNARTALQSVAPDRSASSAAEGTGVASVQPTPAAKFEAATVMKRVAPSYPRLAREHRIEGQVVLRASVGIDGRIRKVEIVEGNPILAEAAADAMRQWRYAPATLDGVPVASVVMAAMRFEFAA